jgi:hypothetical protein
MEAQGAQHQRRSRQHGSWANQEAARIAALYVEHFVANFQLLLRVRLWAACQAQVASLARRAT